MFEDTTEVIIILNSNERGQTMANRKRTSNNLQNATQKYKDRARRTPLRMVKLAMHNIL